MADLLHPFRKKPASAVDRIALERQEGIAHSGLYDLVTFHDALEEEMATMCQNPAFDKDLFERMAAVKEKYMQMMRGFWDFSEDRQRNMMIVFADAVQDLMASMHKQRSH